MRTAESVVLTDWPPGPGRAVDVDLEVVGVDGDLDLVRLGQHGHGGRRGVDPPLGLGDRDPLHPVGAGLVLEAEVGVGALDQEDRLVHPVLVRGVLGEDLDLPLLGRGVAQVHVVEVAGEEVGLVAALGAPDLDDHVAPVVGVLGQQQRLDALLERARPAPRSPSDLPAHELAVVARRLGRASRVPVARSWRAAVSSCQARDDLAELLVAAGQVAQAVGVREGGRVGQVGLDGVELRLERGDAGRRTCSWVVSRRGRASGWPAARADQSCAAGAGSALALPLRSP